MYCSKCGKKIKENAKFCENCGTKVGKNGVNDSIKDSVPNNDKITKTKFHSNLPPSLQKYQKVMYGGIAIVLLLVCFFAYNLFFGGKTLTCSVKVPYPQEIVVKFKHDKIDLITFNKIMDAEDFNEDDIDEMKEQASDVGVKLSVKKKSKKLYISFSGSFEEINELMGGDIGISDEKLKYESVKKSFEDSSMTCE